MSEKTVDSVVGREEHVLLLDALEAYGVHCRKMAFKAEVAGLGLGHKIWMKKASAARVLQGELRDIQH